MYAIQELRSGHFVSNVHLENSDKGHFFRWCETDRFRKKLFDTAEAANSIAESLSADRSSKAIYKVVEVCFEELASTKLKDVKKGVRNPASKYAIRNPENGQYIGGDFTEGALSDAKLFAMTTLAAEFVAKKAINLEKYHNYDIVRFAIKKKP